jgi:hypothetical protein
VVALNARPWRRRLLEISLYPGGNAWPGTSTVNFAAGKIRGNNALVSPGATGDMTILTGSNGTAHVVVDAFGSFR